MMMKWSSIAISAGRRSAAVSRRDGVFEHPRGGVGLDAALGVEEKVVVAFAGFEGGDVVGDHAVEPADAVRAGDAEPADVFDRGEGGGGEKGVQAGRCGGGRHLRTLDYMGVMRVWALGAVLAALGPMAGGQGLMGPASGMEPTHRDSAAMNGAQGGAKDIIMTSAQAKELLASVDEIMAFAAKDTGLAGVANVKRRLVTRDEVNKYLIKSFDEDESSKRLQRSEIVLKKFGLLDRDFQLRPFLLKLLTEQIAGYYDDKTKESEPTQLDRVEGAEAGAGA